MRNARISFILWLLFPMLAVAQLPPLTRSVLTTNIPAFGAAGQALFRIAVPPYLNWSNVVASGGLSISDSNNIINLASNYTWAVSNYAWTASSGLTNELTTVSNAAINASSNYTFAVSNLVVASTNGQFIEKTGGVGTNTTLRQVSQTGPALTIGTNSGAVFSVMGVTNGPGWAPLVQIGSASGPAANSGGTNTLIITTNSRVGINKSAPVYPLDVVGNIQSSANIIANGGIIQSTAGIEGTATENPKMTPGAGAFAQSWMVSGRTGNYPSNNICMAGQLIASNGVVAKVHSGYASNSVPLTVIPHIGTTTNVIEAQGSNGVAILTLTEPGVLTVKSNIILSSVRWVDSPVSLYWASTGPTAPSSTSVAPGSQILGMGFTVAGIGNEKVYGSFQVNHNVCASNATVYTEHHLHVSPTNAPSAGSSNIAFTIVYDWANIGGTRFGPYTNTVQIGLTAQTYNNLIEFGHQTNFFPGVSAVSRCTIYRSAATSNEFNAPVILDGVDVHYPIDRLGSASDTAP